MLRSASVSELLAELGTEPLASRLQVSHLCTAEGIAMSPPRDDRNSCYTQTGLNEAPVPCQQVLKVCCWPQCRLSQIKDPVQ